MSSSVNPVHHQCTKRIDLRYHFVRQHLAEKKITLQYVQSESNVADLLTKSVSVDTLRRLRPAMGVVPAEQPFA